MDLDSDYDSCGCTVVLSLTRPWWFPPDITNNLNPYLFDKHSFIKPVLVAEQLHLIALD